MPALPSRPEEESLVRNFFADTPAGFFVDVGARHPAAGSKTFHLEAAGWTGVLIEPQPHLAARLAAERSAVVFAVACVSPSEAGKTVALRVSGPPSTPARAAGSKTIITVPGRTLDDILEEAVAPTPIDLLSIRAEGRAIEVLEGFDLDYWRPRLLLLEDRVDDLKKHEFLIFRGYRLIRYLANSGWYVPAGSPSRPSRHDRWQIVRKYYLGLPFRTARNALRRVTTKLKNLTASR